MQFNCSVSELKNFNTSLFHIWYHANNRTYYQYSVSERIRGKLAILVTPSNFKMASYCLSSNHKTQARLLAVSCPTHTKSALLLSEFIIPCSEHRLPDHVVILIWSTTIILPCACVICGKNSTIVMYDFQLLHNRLFYRFFNTFSHSALDTEIKTVWHFFFFLERHVAKDKNIVSVNSIVPIFTLILFSVFGLHAIPTKRLTFIKHIKRRQLVCPAVLRFHRAQVFRETFFEQRRS